MDVTKHERDWVFDLSCPVQMHGMGFLKTTVPGQSCPIQPKKTPFPLVQQKLWFDDWTGLVVNKIERDILINLVNLINLIQSYLSL
jgi:hypothetical protein